MSKRRLSVFISDVLFFKLGVISGTTGCSVSSIILFLINDFIIRYEKDYGVISELEVKHE